MVSVCGFIAFVGETTSERLTLWELFVFGGAFLSAFVSVPTAVVSLSAWAVLAWYFDRPGRLRIAWTAALLLGMLSIVQRASGSADLGPGDVGIAAMGQALALLAMGFVIPTRPPEIDGPLAAGSTK